MTAIVAVWTRKTNSGLVVPRFHTVARPAGHPHLPPRESRQRNLAVGVRTRDDGNRDSTVKCDEKEKKIIHNVYVCRKDKKTEEHHRKRKVVWKNTYIHIHDTHTRIHMHTHTYKYTVYKRTHARKCVTVYVNIVYNITIIYITPPPQTAAAQLPVAFTFRVHRPFVRRVCASSENRSRSVGRRYRFFHQRSVRFEG